jgi:hypothetical protein
MEKDRRDVGPAGDAAGGAGHRQAGVVVEDVDDLHLGSVGEAPVVTSACQHSTGLFGLNAFPGEQGRLCGWRSTRFVKGWPTTLFPDCPQTKADSARRVGITTGATDRSRPQGSHASGDVDCPRHTGRPQELRKNLLRIRQGVGRNLAVSVTTADPGKDSNRTRDTFIGEEITIMNKIRMEATGLLGGSIALQVRNPAAPSLPRPLDVTIGRYGPGAVLIAVLMTAPSTRARSRWRRSSPRTSCRYSPAPG